MAFLRTVLALLAAKTPVSVWGYMNAANAEPSASVANGTNCCGCRRSEEHTSELQSLMRTSYAVFCLKKKKKQYKSRTCMNKNYKQQNKIIKTKDPTNSYRSCAPSKNNKQQKNNISQTSLVQTNKRM